MIVKFVMRASLNDFSSSGILESHKIIKPVDKVTKNICKIAATSKTDMKIILEWKKFNLFPGWKSRMKITQEVKISDFFFLMKKQLLVDIKNRFD